MPGRLFALTVALFAAIAVPTHAIIGGTPATESYPWMTSLQVSQNHICGGSLVRPDTILTAAHCVQGEAANDLSVVLGRHTLSGVGGERIGVKSVEINEQYSTDPNGGHDIALVRLKRPSEFDTLDIVTPDQKALWAPGSPVRVIGWGSSVFAIGPGSDSLMQADIDVISDAECDQSYNGLAHYGFDAATMLCAGKRIVGLEDSCQGDSGGPLVADKGDGYVLVGTVSMGLGCGFPLFYGVYGRLGGDELQQWLAAHLDASGNAVPSPLASPSEVKLRVRRARAHRRKVRVRITVSAPVTAVKATLRRHGKVVGRGGLPRVRKRATIVISTRSKKLRRARLRITATDAGGHPVTHREPVSLRR
jgi:secreted trypsin-like serine protease